MTETILAMGSHRRQDVLIIRPDGSETQPTVFEVAIDPTATGEKEFAAFEFLRRLASTRCPGRES